MKVQSMTSVEVLIFTKRREQKTLIRERLLGLDEVILGADVDEAILIEMRSDSLVRLGEIAALINGWDEVTDLQFTCL